MSLRWEIGLRFGPAPWQRELDWIGQMQMHEPLPAARVLG